MKVPLNYQLLRAYFVGIQGRLIWLVDCWFFRLKVALLEGITGEVPLCLEGKVVRHFILRGEIEEADRPMAVAVKTVDDVRLDLLC
jgi:hypothetical protein